MQLPYRFGNYLITRKLASGGMAEIFRAKFIGEDGFEKNVAIKRLLPEWSADQNFITMLIDEAKALVHLQHTNIVQIIELGKDQNTYFLSMELVEGLDLGRLFNNAIRNKIDLPLKFKLFIILQVLTALDFAHNSASSGNLLKIVHRDISPPNVLLSWNGEVKVADFGIAKGTHRTYHTAVAQAKGKYSYMSPEQARGEDVDHRTDIYAVGILLYELITSSRLFDGKTDLEVIEQVKNGNIPLGRLESIDNELRTIVLKSLAQDKQKRHQSANSLLTDLQTYAKKNDLLTSTFEFRDFLKINFLNEFSHDEEEQSISEQIYRKTKPLQNRKSFLPNIKFTSKHILYYSAAFLPLLLFILIPSSSNIIKTPKPKEPLALSAIDQPFEKDKNTQNTTDKIQPKKTVPESIGGFININAKPWGYVTIPGFIQKKETPINNLPIKKGKYLVKVYYEPTNQWLQDTIDIKENSKTNCLAIFDENPHFTCNSNNGIASKLR